MVDEEHDGAYKQDESPRYHGRDVAVMRGAARGLPGRARLGDAVARVLREREERQVPRAACCRSASRPQGLPQVEIVDRRAVLRAGGEPILTPAAARGARRAPRAPRAEPGAPQPPRLRHEPAVPRVRPGGHVPELLGLADAPPHAAGWRAATTAATRRSTPDGLRRRAAAPTCGSRASAPSRSPRPSPPRFPTARVERLDRDRASRRGVLQQTLAAFEQGEIDILVGTQMIAKGHDFPRVTLVGVVDADVGLGIPDFRAAERTFQLLTQVAGRAGRGDDGGRGDPADAHARPLRARATPAPRTTRRSSSASSSSAARWATRRSRRSST